MILTPAVFFLKYLSEIRTVYKILPAEITKSEVFGIIVPYLLFNFQKNSP